MKDGFPVSIAELLTAGERPLPSEAVAIVLDVCAQVMRRTASPSVLPAISPGAVFIDASGSTTIAGGVPVEDDQTVLLLGRLLQQMLPVPGTPSAVPVPARLRQLAARAGSGEGPGLSVGRFAAALRRFGPEQTRAAIRNLFERWHARRVTHQPAAEGAAEAPRADRRASLGPDVFRRLLREADEDRYRAGAAEESRPAAAERRRRHPRIRMAVVLAATLLLAGVGAAYWLNADEQLPQLPLSPAIFSGEPPPPTRSGWELLPGTGPLAVGGDQIIRSPFPPAGTAGETADVAARRPARGQSAAPQPVPSPRTDHRP